MFRPQFYILNITLFDRYDSAYQYLLIAPINQMPRIKLSSTGYKNIDVVLGYPIQIYLPYIFEDLDDDILSYSASVTAPS